MAIFSDEVLLYVIQYLKLDDKLRLKLVSRQWRNIVNHQLQLYVTLSRKRKMYEPGEEQYLTSIAASGDRNELRDFYFPIRSAIIEIFKYKQLKILHIGPTLGGLTADMLHRIFSYCAVGLEELSWVVEIKSSHTIEKLEEFRSLSFPILQTLSIQIRHSYSHAVNENAFLHLCMASFPALEDLAVHVYTSPGDAASGCAWRLYKGIFDFIAHCHTSLRNLRLDYFHFQLRSPIAEDSWLEVSELSEISNVSQKLRKLQLCRLHMSVPGLEGDCPWQLGAQLLASQKELKDLFIKQTGRMLQPFIQRSITECAKTLKSLRLVACGYAHNHNFNAKLLRDCKQLRRLELSFFTGLTHCLYFPQTLIRLKLRGNYSPDDLTEILKTCVKLRKLSLDSDGKPWTPVTAETVSTCFARSSSLKSLRLHSFDKEDITAVCDQNGWKFSLARKLVQYAIVRIPSRKIL